MGSAASPGAGGSSRPDIERVVRVLPDEPAIDKVFDYAVPRTVIPDVRVGSVVRVALHGRRVGGWVVEDRVSPPTGIEIRPIAKVTGWGPQPDLIELARWAAWRWYGRPAHFLRTASAERAVTELPSPARSKVPVPAPPADWLAEAFEGSGSAVRLPPAADSFAVALTAAARGHALILVPSVAGARHLGIRLRRAGVPVAVMPDDWAQARAGATVVGSRAAAWAPVAGLAAAVVLDEHDEAYQEERAPTWHARDVLVERCRRAGVPCVLVSPAPTLEALVGRRLLKPSRAEERAGWPVVQVVDRRREDLGRTGLYSTPTVKALRSRGRVLGVLNRTGRSRLLACRSCGELARCEVCESAVRQVAEGRLRCHRCDAERPPVCGRCGSVSFKNLRVGVTRAREELEALVGEPVAEVSGDTAGSVLPEVRVFVGTEAVLHQVDRAEAVVFLDFDQELLVPRYRAAEQAFGLLVRAARVVGDRAHGGRILVQTRLPRHEAIVAALHADPSRLTTVERERRRALRYPPFEALAEVSGAAAELFVERLDRSTGVEIRGPQEGRWRLRATDHETLCDALAGVDRPLGRLRVAVDPRRI